MNTITSFWQWVQENQRTLRNLKNEKPRIQKQSIIWLDKNLHKYCKGLDSILVLPTREKDLVKLIISANGNPKYFDQVIALIEKAPILQNWKFVAFVQPTKYIDEMEAGLDTPYVFKDITLKASELKFIPFEYESCKKIDMIVYLKNFTAHCNNKNLLVLVYYIMQDILGEKALYENINFVELAQLPNEDNEELIYLYDLQLYLDEINNYKKFNSTDLI